MDLGLQGKHEIVTGGSRGISKAIAPELAREGVDVAIAAHSEADLAATARKQLRSPASLAITFRPRARRS
jgi:NAD(P)-dependent dehydrogenase (short-subunit alcohol dehydrogenase family)